MDNILSALTAMLTGLCLVIAVSGVVNTDRGCDQTQCEDCPFPCDQHNKE